MTSLPSSTSTCTFCHTQTSQKDICVTCDSMRQGNLCLDDYDYIHLGFSGGKDSMASLLWCVYESGLQDLSKLIVSCCDTGNEDPLTYSLLEKVSTTIHPIVMLSPKRDFWELAHFKSRFPSAKARFCTTELKIITSGKFINSLADKNKNRVLLLSGVRKEEGSATNNRGNLDGFYLNETFALPQFLPIYNHSLQDVWDMHTKYLPQNFSIDLIQNDPNLSEPHKAELIKKQVAHGVPRNPLYDMGATRVGCFPCINSRKKEVRAMAKFRPSRVGFIRKHEISIGQERLEKGSKADYSSMFARTTVPEHMRSRTITTKSGEQMKVATIDDVVAWSQTKRGGRQITFDFYDFHDDSPLSCDAKGLCE